MLAVTPHSHCYGERSAHLHCLIMLVVVTPGARVGWNMGIGGQSFTFPLSGGGASVVSAGRAGAVC